MPAVDSDHKAACSPARPGRLLLAACLAVAATLATSTLATTAIASVPADSITPESGSENPSVNLSELVESNEQIVELQTGILGQSEKLEDYRDAIAELESSQGPWGYGLAEQLSGLGQTYQVRGRHREAIAIFDRAVHISRINNGLYDLGQVPIIEDMLESLKARGLWGEVHKRHQQLYWLHKRNYGANDPRMLPVIDRLGKWYINDYALNPQRRMMDQLVDAHNLFEQAIAIISGTYGHQDLRLIEPLRGLVMSNWFFANYRGDTSSSTLERERHIREMGVDQVTYIDDGRNDTRLTQYLRNNYASGKQAIERMVEIYTNSPDAPPGAAAQAKVELADWEQLFDRRRTATDLYQEAYRELASGEATQSQAEKLFDRPVALPALEFIESDVEQPSPVRHLKAVADQEPVEPIHYVLVSFDVNRFGETEHIEVLESQPQDSDKYRARVKRSLEHTRFRPRMVDGEPVDTEGLIQKYVFTSD